MQAYSEGGAAEILPHAPEDRLNLVFRLLGEGGLQVGVAGAVGRQQWRWSEDRPTRDLTLGAFAFRAGPALIGATVGGGIISAASLGMRTRSSRRRQVLADDRVQSAAAEGIPDGAGFVEELPTIERPEYTPRSRLSPRRRSAS